jgi:hypothetical protein
MISFKEYKQRQLAEAGVAPEPSAQVGGSSPATDLEKKVADTVRWVFAQLKGELHRKADPKQGGLWSGLRNWWWNVWYGTGKNQRPDHPFYRRPEEHQAVTAAKVSPHAAAAGVPPMGEAVVTKPSVRLIYEWNRVVDNTRANVEYLIAHLPINEAESYTAQDLDDLLNAWQTNLIRDLTAIVRTHLKGASLPSAPINPVEPSGPSPVKPAAPGSQTNPTAATPETDADRLDATDTMTTLPGVGRDTAPPVEAPLPPGSSADTKPTRRWTGEIPAGLRHKGGSPQAVRGVGRQAVKDAAGNPVKFLHEDLYKVYDNAGGGDAGAQALRKHLMETLNNPKVKPGVAIHILKKLIQHYGWHPPGFNLLAWKKSSIPHLIDNIVHYVHKHSAQHDVQDPLRSWKELGYVPGQPHGSRDRRLSDERARRKAAGEPEMTPEEEESFLSQPVQKTPGQPRQPKVPAPAAAEEPVSPEEPAGQGYRHPPEHQALVDQIDRIDWKSLHKDIHNGTLRPEARPVVDEDKYKSFASDPAALDDQTDDEAALAMKGGPKYHDKPEGADITPDVLDEHGLPRDAAGLAKIAAIYPRKDVAAAPTRHASPAARPQSPMTSGGPVRPSAAETAIAPKMSEKRFVNMLTSDGIVNSMGFPYNDDEARAIYQKLIASHKGTPGSPGDINEVFKKFIADHDEAMNGGKNIPNHWHDLFDQYLNKKKDPTAAEEPGSEDATDTMTTLPTPGAGEPEAQKEPTPGAGEPEAQKEPTPGAEPTPSPRQQDYEETDSYSTFALRNRRLIQRVISAKVPGFESANKIENDLLKPVFHHLAVGDAKVKGRGKIASHAAHRLLSDLATGRLTRDQVDKMLGAERKGEAIRAYVHGMATDPNGTSPPPLPDNGGAGASHPLVIKAKVKNPAGHAEMEKKLQTAYPGVEPEPLLNRLAKIADGLQATAQQIKGLESPDDRLKYLVDAVSSDGIAYDGPDQHEDTIKSLEDDPATTLRYMWRQMTGELASDFAQQYPDLTYKMHGSPADHVANPEVYDKPERASLDDVEGPDDERGARRDIDDSTEEEEGARKAARGYGTAEAPPTKKKKKRPHNEATLFSVMPIAERIDWMRSLLASQQCEGYIPKPVIRRVMTLDVRERVEYFRDLLRKVAR